MPGKRTRTPLATPPPVRRRTGGPVRLALTVGDPAGVGPELLLRALADPRLVPPGGSVRPIVYGRRSDLLAAYGRLRQIGAAPLLDPAALASEGEPAARFGLIEPGDTAPPAVAGVYSDALAPVVVSSLEAAVADVQRGRADALVTGPINKRSLAAMGLPFAGHSELLAERAGSADWTMVLAGGRLRVGLATTHVAIRAVAQLLTPELIVRKARVLLELLVRSYGVPEPRLAVCALNPHAGDGGRFGDEEARIIAPAVEALHATGAAVSGPWPADSLFARAAAREFDAVLAMYHDQGLGPLKLHAPRAAVNITAGLPFVRTSPDHGVAYDLAGRGLADPHSLGLAIRLAIRFVQGRRRAADGAAPVRPDRLGPGRVG